MNYFLSLKTSVELYESTMSLWLKCRDLLKIDYLESYYEELTDDLEGAAKRLIDYINLDWEEGVLGYWKTDNRRYLSTPSYQDISQPVYKRSVGRWAKYKNHLSAYLPILQPFVNRYGYPDT